MEGSSNYSLHLSRFKGIEQHSISFPANGVILLDGRSGIGKTTILEAISFVLYDGARNSCYPRSDRNSRRKQDPTWVRLEFPSKPSLNIKFPSDFPWGLQIYRQRRPNLLQVVGPGISLVDDSAQQYLNRTFGPMSNWLAGGYLKQNELCAFLSMSSSEKLSFLQELSLPDSFEQLFTRTSEKISETTHYLQEITASIRVYQEMYLRLYEQAPPEVQSTEIWSLDKFQTLLKEYQIDKNYPEITFEHLPKALTQVLEKAQLQYRDQLHQTRNELTAEQTRFTQLEAALNQRKHLQSELSQLESRLIDYPDVTEQIHSTEKELEQITEQIALVQKSVRKTQLLAAKTEIERRLAQIPKDHSEYTSQQLDEFERILAGPNLDQIDTDLKEIEQARTYQKLMLDYQQRKKLLDKRDQLQKDLDTYPVKSVADELERVNETIWSISLHQQKLVCPTCSENLYLNGRQLEKCPDLTECSHNDDNKNLEKWTQKKYQLQQEEVRFNQRESLEKSLKEILSQIESLPDVPEESLPEKVPSKAQLSEQNLAILENSLLKTKSDWEKIPQGSFDLKEERQKIETSQERIRLDRDVALISDELSQLKIASFKSKEPMDNIEGSEINRLEEKRAQVKTQLEKLRAQLSQRETLFAQISQLNGQISALPEETPDKTQWEVLEKRIQTLEENFLKLSQDISIQHRLIELSDLYSKHEQFVKQEQTFNQRLGQLQKIRSTLITAEYVILDTILSQMNGTLSEVLGILFAEPITVTLRSLRQLKSNDRIKPEINLEIGFKGAEFSSLNEMSGGEKSRVSLALVIAFSRLGKSPFLLLDESLSSLDVITKELAISAIKTYLNEKLIIAVNHDTTEGVYDSVIRLS